MKFEQAKSTRNQIIMFVYTLWLLTRLGMAILAVIEPKYTLISYAFVIVDHVSQFF